MCNFSSSLIVSKPYTAYTCNNIGTILSSNCLQNSKERMYYLAFRKTEQTDEELFSKMALIKLKQIYIYQRLICLQPITDELLLWNIVKHSLNDLLILLKLEQYYINNVKEMKTQISVTNI